MGGHVGSLLGPWSRPPPLDIEAAHVDHSLHEVRMLDLFWPIVYNWQVYFSTPILWRGHAQSVRKPSSQAPGEPGAGASKALCPAPGCQGPWHRNSKEGAGQSAHGCSKDRS